MTSQYAGVTKKCGTIATEANAKSLNIEVNYHYLERQADFYQLDMVHRYKCTTQVLPSSKPIIKSSFQYLYIFNNTNKFESNRIV